MVTGVSSPVCTTEMMVLSGQFGYARADVITLLDDLSASGGRTGGASATARTTGACGGGPAVRGKHAPLLQPGAAGREAVAVQRAPAGAGGVRAQQTAAVTGAFAFFFFFFFRVNCGFDDSVRLSCAEESARA